MIEITDAGSTVYGDPTQGPFDGVEDSLIGVVNHSSQPVGALALTSSTDLFGFDGDGICAYGVGSCGPTGYEGPNTSFSDISPDASNGVVSFPAGLAPGASTYFALEESLSTANLATGTGQSQVTATEVGQAPNPREALVECSTAKPINCATGDFWHTFTDLSIPGRGPALNLQRTYSAFGHAGDGMFGFGWSGTYGMRAVADAAGNVTVSQENGSTITFTANGAGGFTAPSRVMASLVTNADGTRTMTDAHGGLTHTFAASGELLNESDRNGYTTTLTYSGAVLTTVSDPAGRTLTFTTDPAGHVTKVTDPAGRAVTYAYDAAGNQASATDPAGGTWAFTYDAAHQMLTMTDPRGGAVTNTYDAAGRVTAQSDAMGRTTTLAYTGDPSTTAGSTTTITDPVGNATTEAYQQLQMQSITHGAGTPVAATTTFSYDPFTLGLASTTDPNAHTTTYTWDRRGNQTSSTDPLGRTTTTTWTGLNEPSAITDPAGNTTTFGYDARGNLTGQYRSLNSSTMQAATLTYASATFPGDVTAMTDPNGKTSTMVYDTNGDLTQRTDPVGDVTTFGYDAIGHRTTAVSARGNMAGGSLRVRMS